jgi:hypothetical protein
LHPKQLDIRENGSAISCIALVGHSMLFDCSTAYSCESRGHMSSVLRMLGIHRQGCALSQCLELLTPVHVVVESPHCCAVTNGGTATL